MRSSALTFLASRTVVELCSGLDLHWRSFSNLLRCKESVLSSSLRASRATADSPTMPELFTTAHVQHKLLNRPQGLFPAVPVTSASARTRLVCRRKGQPAPKVEEETSSPPRVSMTSSIQLESFVDTLKKCDPSLSAAINDGEPRARPLPSPIRALVHDDGL